MKIKYYLDNQHYLAGVTLKDILELEENNLALHSCQQEEHIHYNREQLAYYLEQPLEHFVFAQQTHSDQFYQVQLEDRGKGVYSLDSAIPQTDALYTYESGIVLTSMSADCVPLLFYHTQKGIVGAIHSGWRGTVQEITTKTFTHLIQHEGCSPEDFYVILGPCLSQEKFEVDSDVAQQFQTLGYAEDYISMNEATGKYHIHNQLVVKTQCERVGIPSQQIITDSMCTYGHSDGFSYRENKQIGRHVSFIMKKPVL